MVPSVVARQDHELTARITRTVQLFYEDDASPGSGRPSFVRAGSSLANCAGRFAVVQDDANFLALVHPEQGTALSFALPAGEGGSRAFDDDHHNKRDKLDLEAGVMIAGRGSDFLLMMGSGSAPQREKVVVVSWRGSEPGDTRVLEAPALYRSLRDARNFSGSGLNVEGMVLLDDVLRLFQRGNEPPHGGVQPVNATCDLPWEEVWAHLQHPEVAPPPEPRNVIQYELGELDGVRLGFSDAAVADGGHILFSASSEESLDGGDGRVTGSVLGVIRSSGEARWTPLTEQDGEIYRGKVEGLELAPGDPNAAYFVVDADDPDEPSQLCRVDLAGPWYE